MSERQIVQVSVWLPESMKEMGAVQWVTEDMRWPSKADTSLGSDKLSKGMLIGSVRSVSMTLSSAPKSTKINK